MDDDVLLILEARDAAQTGRARRLREAAGLAQTEVARSIGVTPSCVSRWEGGLRRPAGAPAVRWTRLLHELASYLARPSASLQPEPPNRQRKEVNRN